MMPSNTPIIGLLKRQTTLSLVDLFMDQELLEDVQLHICPLPRS